MCSSAPSPASARASSAGAVGAVSGLASAFPEAVAARVREPTDERAQRVEGLRAALSGRPLQASAKAALGLRGISLSPDVRAPLRPLSDDNTTALRAELEQWLGAEALV